MEASSGATIPWRRIALIIGCLIVVGVALDVAPRLFGRNGVTVSMFDIGQGDALLIQSPDGESILVDGGPNRSILTHLRSALGLFDHTIDAVVLTHPDADHVTGLIDVLNRYQVSRVFMSGVIRNTPEARIFVDAVEKQGIPIVEPFAGQTVQIGTMPLMMEMVAPERSYRAVAPENVNETSSMFRLVFHDFSMLFTGDSGLPTEAGVIEHGADITSDVLKVGHHGSNSATGAVFLEAVKPNIALISVGSKNTFGHPSMRVVRRLERAGAVVYRTDTDGTIVIHTDGTTGSISTNHSKENVDFR